MRERKVLICLRGLANIVSLWLQTALARPWLDPAGCPHCLTAHPLPGSGCQWSVAYLLHMASQARPGQATAGVTERSQLLFCCSVPLISDNMWPQVMATSSSHMRHPSTSPAMITIPWARPRHNVGWILVTTVCWLARRVKPQWYSVTTTTSNYHVLVKMATSLGAWKWLRWRFQYLF